LAELLDGQLLKELPSPLPVACIGPATIDAAQASGMQVELIPDEHTVDGLLEALVKWHSTRQKG
jgi:uroporphyrinogen III methyltransferase/synthase